jgi:hypothetical protein
MYNASSNILKTWEAFLYMHCDRQYIRLANLSSGRFADSKMSVNILEAKYCRLTYLGPYLAAGIRQLLQVGMEPGIRLSLSSTDMVASVPLPALNLNPSRKGSSVTGC